MKNLGNVVETFLQEVGYDHVNELILFFTTASNKTKMFATGNWPCSNSLFLSCVQRLYSCWISVWILQHLLQMKKKNLQHEHNTKTNAHEINLRNNSQGWRPSEMQSEDAHYCIGRQAGNRRQNTAHPLPEDSKVTS